MQITSLHSLNAFLLPIKTVGVQVIQLVNQFIKSSVEQSMNSPWNLISNNNINTIKTVAVVGLSKRSLFVYLGAFAYSRMCRIQMCLGLLMIVQEQGELETVHLTFAVCLVVLPL